MISEWDRPASILTINSGSSSLKFAVFQIGNTEDQVLVGQFDRIGHDRGKFRVRRSDGTALVDQTLNCSDHDHACEIFIAWLQDQEQVNNLAAVGHRIVHGGAKYTAPQLVDPELIASLHKLIPLAPEHLPQEIKAIEAVSGKYSKLTQVACFDTSFHRQMPRQAQMYALPKQLRDDGVMRYGFHGLSYEYIVSQLRKEDPVATRGRLIIAHLGNGASMAAVQDGKSVETTMGFTPAGGLMMGTRSGDIDPGVVLHLVDQNGVNATGLNELFNKQSGLLGVSGISSDMKDLLALEGKNQAAADAIELFCYQSKKFLGSLVAILGGLDSLVFTGGIGEHAAAVRWRICSGLEFLGIHLDRDRNNQNARLISAVNSSVTVRVMNTNEELMIARHTAHLLHTL